MKQQVNKLKEKKKTIPELYLEISTLLSGFDRNNKWKIIRNVEDLNTVTQLNLINI